MKRHRFGIIAIYKPVIRLKEWQVKVMLRRTLFQPVRDENVTLTCPCFLYVCVCVCVFAVVVVIELSYTKTHERVCPPEQGQAAEIGEHEGMNDNNETDV